LHLTSGSIFLLEKEKLVMPKETVQEVPENFYTKVVVEAEKNGTRFCKLTAEYWSDKSGFLLVEKTVVGGLLALAE
jgi:hypothetical protein